MDAIASIEKLRPMDTMTQNPENRAFNDKFMLRLPDGMRERIKMAAEKNGRSMNAEIVATLQDKYPVRGLLQRLQAMMYLADDVILDDSLTPQEREEELNAVKNHALRIIGKMSEEEFHAATKDLWYPGELDVFEDWPPKGWRINDNNSGRS